MAVARGLIKAVVHVFENILLQMSGRPADLTGAQVGQTPGEEETNDVSFLLHSLSRGIYERCSESKALPAFPLAPPAFSHEMVFYLKKAGLIRRMIGGPRKRMRNCYRSSRMMPCPELM